MFSSRGEVTLRWYVQVRKMPIDCSHPHLDSLVESGTMDMTPSPQPPRWMIEFPEKSEQQPYDPERTRASEHLAPWPDSEPEPRETQKGLWDLRGGYRWRRLDKHAP